MSHAIYRFGPFTVNTGAHTLLKGDTRLSIQEQPLQVLLALLESSGQVVTREALRIRLWGTDTFVDFDQSLNSAVRRLRLALEDNSRDPVYVETIPRIGFRFLPEVNVEPGAASAAGAATSLVVIAPEPETHPQAMAVAQPAATMLEERRYPPAARRYPVAVTGGAILVLLLGLLLGIGFARVRSSETHPATGQSARLPGDQAAGETGHVLLASATVPASLRGERTSKADLRGWYRLQQRTQGDFQEAENAFGEALRREPGDPSALTGLAEAEILMALNGDHPVERVEHARQVGQHMLALAPHMAAAHTVIGAADALNDWNDGEAEQEFRTALHLQPGDSLTHLWFAVFVLLPRRDYRAAEQEAMTAVSEDPLSLIAHTDLGWILYCEGKREAAREEYQFVLRLNPGFVPAQFRFHQMQAAEGRQEEESLTPRTSAGALRVTNAVATRPAGNRAVSPACAQASDLAAVPGSGRLPVLRAAVREHCPTAYFFGQDPQLTSLRKDPGFLALLQSVHPARGVRP